MKKILIRVESHSKSWVWWMESRILEFCKILKHDFYFLTNSKFLVENKFLWEKNIFSDYFSFYWILKDIFSFRDFEIIESNGLRDNLIASLNFLIFYPFYKVNKTKFFLSIHGNLAILGMKWLKKFIYNFILKIGLILSDKIIVVSEELKDYFSETYKIKKEKFEVVVNFINTENFNKEKWENKKILIVSRLDFDKYNWVKNAIYRASKDNFEIDIYWNWEFLKILKNDFKDFKNINFLGFKKQTEIKYNDYFLIFAMWRALLEWMLSWLRGILINNHKIICEINEKNYEDEKYSNFTWKLVFWEKNLYENFHWKVVKIEEIDLFLNKKSNLINQIKSDFDIKNLKDFYK